MAAGSLHHGQRSLKHAGLPGLLWVRLSKGLGMPNAHPDLTGTGCHTTNGSENLSLFLQRPPPCQVLHKHIPVLGGVRGSEKTEKAGERIGLRADRTKEQHELEAVEETSRVYSSQMPSRKQRNHHVLL